MPENPDTEAKRIDSFRKGYQKDTPDLIIADYHINYRGLCFEFKRPTKPTSSIRSKEKDERTVSEERLQICYY